MEAGTGNEAPETGELAEATEGELLVEGDLDAGRARPAALFLHLEAFAPVLDVRARRGDVERQEGEDVGGGADWAASVDARRHPGAEGVDGGGGRREGVEGGVDDVGDVALEVDDVVDEGRAAAGVADLDDRGAVVEAEGGEAGHRGGHAEAEGGAEGGVEGEGGGRRLKAMVVLRKEGKSGSRTRALTLYPGGRHSSQPIGQHP